MNKNILLLIVIIALIACKKDADVVPSNQLYTVDFIYNGQNVTYGIIKRDYHLDDKGLPLNKTISKLWLDRNLGADRQATHMNDSLAAGDLFQWGRPDDGHQLRTSDTTHAVSGSITPNHNKFIAKPLLSGDWLATSNDSLWNDQNNTNCPCPDGWRVPTIEELLMEMHSWNSTDLNSAFNSPLKWVSGGNRDNHGTERYSDYWAFIWSSTFKDNGEAMQLAIIGSDTSMADASKKIFGNSVRCIKNVGE